MGKVLQGGCHICHKGQAVWFGANAQAVAARHYDATGHATWVDVTIMWEYGEPNETDSQPVSGAR